MKDIRHTANRLRGLILLTALILSCASPTAAPAVVATAAPAARPAATTDSALPGLPTGGPAGAPSAGRTTAPGTISPQATLDALRTVVPPARDEADLVRRFKQACGAPAATAVPLFREAAVGESQPFWVLDEPNRRFIQVSATLRQASPHLLFFVQDGLDFDAASLASSADVFEQKTYPMLRQFFGDLPEEPRISIFNGRVPGVGGYFSAGDLYPRSVNPYSNERVLVFMSLEMTRPGTDSYDAILAHEAQHFVHWVVKPQQDSWINEGASELAMAIGGYDQSAMARSFLSSPETQLDAWAERPMLAIPHYGGGYLMLEYFAQRLGGYENIKPLIASHGSSVQTFESFLAGPAGRQSGITRFDDLFRDFVVANLLNDRTLADGRFGYQVKALSQLHASVPEPTSAYPAVSSGKLRPYATRYVDLRPPAATGTGTGTGAGTLDLRFSGSGEVPLYGAPARGGRVQWWGNAADEMDSTLTRAFDLTGATQASLHFSTWFNTERDYDYAGVAVSSDGGCSWQSLPGKFTTDANPVGQNLGNAFTGISGGGATAAWVDETMDLSPFAGQKVLLRFFYVTDQSYHGSGFAVDDVYIPEIGFADDAEDDRGWDAQGFLRSLNATTLDWAVQVIAFTQGGAQIRQVPLTVGPTGELQGSLAVERFGADARRVVVAVSPLVPVTLEGADFKLEAVVR